MKNTLAIVALASCITALCRAASPPPVPESLLACRKLPDEGQRVRCYDAQIDKMSAPVASGSAPPQAAPRARAAVAAPVGSTGSAAAPGSAATTATAATQPSATARFGQETLPPTARAKTPPPPEEAALLSSITGLRAVRPQQYAITLANGQVWRQVEASDIALFLHVGDDVRIEKGTLGSYRLSTSSTGAKNWVRVTRTQ